MDDYLFGDWQSAMEKLRLGVPHWARRVLVESHTCSQEVSGCAMSVLGDCGGECSASCQVDRGIGTGPSPRSDDGLIGIKL